MAQSANTRQASAKSSPRGFFNRDVPVVTWLGRTALAFIAELGAMGIFFFKGALHIFGLPIQFSKFLTQTYIIGARSMLIIMLVAVFTGMVLGLQGYYTLVKFGADGLLGAAVALSLIRELGPVLTAIMIVARAGSAMSAEIGIMRNSEQIDALETMGIDPMRFLIAPRFFACLVAFPLLTALFNVVGILGGWISGSLLLGIEQGIYFNRIESSVVWNDIFGSFAKAFTFAILVATICCFQGYFTHTKKGGFGARGVSNSTTQAVVLSCIMILISDYVLTSFLL